MSVAAEAAGSITSLAGDVLERIGTVSLRASRECFTVASGALLLNQAVSKSGKADTVEHLLGRPAHLAMGAGLGFLATAAVANTLRRVVGTV